MQWLKKTHKSVQHDWCPKIMEIFRLIFMEVAQE